MRSKPEVSMLKGRKMRSTSYLDCSWMMNLTWKLSNTFSSFKKTSREKLLISLSNLELFSFWRRSPILRLCKVIPILRRLFSMELSKSMFLKSRGNHLTLTCKCAAWNISKTSITITSSRLLSMYTSFPKCLKFAIRWSWSTQESINQIMKLSMKFLNFTGLLLKNTLGLFRLVTKARSLRSLLFVN